MVSALEQREMGRGKGDEHNAVDIGVEDAAAEDVKHVAYVETDRAVSGSSFSLRPTFVLTSPNSSQWGWRRGLARSRAWAGYGRTTGGFRECTDFY